MDKILNLYSKAQAMLDKTREADFLAPLLLRLYLAPIFWMAGTSKFNSFEDTAAWFGNSEWGLGLPFPELMAFLATSTEIAGAIHFYRPSTSDDKAFADVSGPQYHQECDLHQ